jgi:hypothetical protein
MLGLYRPTGACSPCVLRFPKRITCRKEPDGALAARVDSGPEADAKAENYRYVKVR